MRKTFLKVALIGLLAAAMPSTFTSCKDYDDDITNLTSAQDALKSQLGTLQTALTAAQSAADAAATQAKAAAATANEALTKAAAATAAAEKAKADAIAEATKQVEALAGKSATKEDLQKLGSEIAAIDANLNKLSETVDENTKNIAALQLQMKTLESFQDILGPLVENFGTPEKVNALMKDLQAARELVDELKNALPEGTTLAQLVQSISKISPNLVTLSSTVAAMPTHAELVYAKQIWIPALTVPGANNNTSAPQVSGYWETRYDEEKEMTYSVWVENEAWTWVQDGVNEDGFPTYKWTNETGNPIYKAYNVGDWYNLTTTNLALSLGFSTAAVDYEFGKNERPATKFNQTIANPIKFEKGTQLVFEDAVMIRVTPTNAVITPEQISLINTQLGNLDEFIAVSEVKKYDGLLTRGAQDNGLWTITFTLKPGYDQKAFAEAVQTAQGKDVLYAVALSHKATGNDAVDADFANRAVTTAYDITLNDQAKASAYALDYWVDNTRVGNIHNRYEYARETDQTNWYPSLVYATNAVTNPANNMLAVYDKAQVVERGTAGYAWVGDYTWSVNPTTGVIQYQVANTWSSTNLPSTTYKYNNSTYSLQPVYNDDRQYNSYFDVEVGKPFTVTLPFENAYAFYVALDLDRAIVSNGSELNAWESYVGKIDGLNTITTEGSIDLTITEAAKVAQGEVIGFRVWAVNYNGTLIDPDGRAFYVQVGQPQAASTSIAATITAPRLDINPGTNNVNLINILSELGDWTNQPSVNVKFTMNTTSNPTTNSNVTVVFGDGTTVAPSDLNGVTLSRNTGTGANANYNAFFKNMNVELGDYNFVDGQAYKGVLTISDKNGLALQTIAVSVTKNLPAAIPAGIAPIAGQITNGEGTAYVTARSFDFATMFNNLTTAYATGNGTATATLAMKSGNDAFGTVSGTTVALPANWKGAEYVNKGTQFTLEIGFNYGAISKANKNAALKDVVRKATYSIDFATQANTISFAWAGTAPSLVDGQAKEVSTDNITLSSIFKKFNGTLTAAMVDGNIQTVSVKVTGDLAKYFTAAITAPTKKTVGNTKTDGVITFTPVAGTNPTTSTVTGKVEITYYDANSTMFKSTKTLTIQMD